MSMDDDEDRTLIMGNVHEGRGHASTSDASLVPKGRLICLDDSLLDPTQKGLEIVLDGREQTLGRAADNTAPILYKNISRNHARVFPLQGRWAIEDLGSANGIWIKGTREKQAVLVPGDYIKIGAVPFQFVLDGPVPGSAPPPPGGAENEDDDDDKTMFLDGAGAKTSQVVEALSAPVDDRKVEAPKQKPVKKAFKEVGIATQNVPEKSGSGKKIVLTVLLLLLAAGGYYYDAYIRVKIGGVEEAHAHEKLYKVFLNAHEMVRETQSAGDLRMQIVDLEKLSKAVKADVGRYPKNLELKWLSVRLQFLRMERALVLSVQDGQVQQAESVVGSVLALIADGWEKATLEQKERVEDMRALLMLAGDVIRVKQFRQRFPEPSRNATVKPDWKEVAAFEKAGQRIVKKKGTPAINALLNARYPLFGRVVSQVDEEDLPLLNQWKEFL